MRLAVAGWVAIQLLLPLRCLIAGDPLDSPPRFCWNMYSYTSSCAGRYVVFRPDGSSSPLNPFALFPRQSGAFVAFHREHLPAFHAWLCSGIEAREQGMRLEGEIRCSSGGHDARYLVRRGLDLCAAETLGAEERATAGRTDGAVTPCSSGSASPSTSP